MRKKQVLDFINDQQTAVERQIKEHWNKKKDKCKDDILMRHEKTIQNIQQTLETLRQQLDTLHHELKSDVDIECYTYSSFSFWGRAKNLTGSPFKSQILDCSSFDQCKEYQNLLKLENQALDEVRTNYANLYSRCENLNGKKGTEFLKGLGFEVPEDEDKSVALMVPLDIDKLYIPLTKAEQTSSNKNK